MNKWFLTTCVVGGIALASLAFAQGPKGGANGPQCAIGQGGGAGEPGMQRGMEKRGGPGEHLLRALEHNPELAKEVGVTDEQIAALKKAQYDNEKTMIRLRSDADLARLEVKNLMQADKVDKAAVMAAVDNAGKVMIELRKAQIGAAIQAKEILGADTMEKIHAKMGQHMKAMRGQGKGRGGPQGRNGGRGPGPGPEGMQESGAADDAAI